MILLPPNNHLRHFSASTRTTYSNTHISLGLGSHLSEILYFAFEQTYTRSTATPPPLLMFGPCLPCLHYHYAGAFKRFCVAHGLSCCFWISPHGWFWPESWPSAFINTSLDFPSLRVCRVCFGCSCRVGLRLAGEGYFPTFFARFRSVEACRSDNDDILDDITLIVWWTPLPTSN